jgi:hypothetical protein
VGTIGRSQIIRSYSRLFRSSTAAFYLLIPFLVSTLMLKRKTAGYRRALFIGIAGVGYLLSARFGGPVRSLMFVGGILLYETSEVARSPRSSLIPAVALIGAAAVMTLESTRAASVALQSAVLFVMLLSFCLSAVKTGGSR